MKYDVSAPNDCKYCYIGVTGAMIGAAVIGGGMSMMSASKASKAAKSAAGAQLESSRLAVELGREGLGFQQEMFDTSRADLAPYRATGGAALGTLNNMFIPGGQGMVQLQGRLNELRAQREVMMGQEQRGAVSPVQQMAAAPRPPRPRPATNVPLGTRGPGERN